MNDSTTRVRGIRILAAVVAVTAVAALTLGPRAIIAPARSAFLEVTAVVTSPLLAMLPDARPDQVLNAILFVPLGAAIALLLPRWAWWIAPLGALALSAVVEHAQASIPGRVPDVDDLLWNGVGGAIGVILVTVPRLAADAVRRAAQRGSVTRT